MDHTIKIYQIPLFLNIIYNNFSGSLTSSSTELTLDGDRRRYTGNSMSKKIVNTYKLRRGYEEVKESNEVNNQLIDSIKDEVVETNPKFQKNVQSILRCKLNAEGDK